jgi:hypothetical protein
MIADYLNAQIPPKKLVLDKGGFGMKGFDLGANTAKRKPREATTNGNAAASSDKEADFMDTDEEIQEDSQDAAPADFIPLNVSEKTSKSYKRGAAGNGEVEATKESVEPNAFFVIDTNPTPVNLNGISKIRTKRSKEDDDTEHKTAKKSKKEKAPIVVPKPESDPKVELASASKPSLKASKVDFSAIETQLQAEIIAGTKAKEEREKAKAEAKIAKKEKKRKRISEGDAEKEVKKTRTDEEDG